MIEKPPSAVEVDSLRESRPRLDPNVSVYLQRYRNKEWYLLVDALAHQHVLVDKTSYRLLQQLERGLSVDAAITRLETHHDIRVEFNDIVQLLGRLQDARMLRGDLKPSLEQSVDDAAAATWRSTLLTPTSIKVPLFDPDNLLSKISGLSSKIVTPQAFIIILLLLAAALTVAMTQWPALELHWRSRFLDPTNLILTLLLYPLIKGLHEMGHGLVARHFGAEVHEFGIMLLVFFPVPYVDATSTATLYNSRHRLLVAAAGMMAELAIAAMAIICWYYLEPGLARDVCFNIAVLAGTSTLLFNGNPLLRFDGYYVLSDAIEIPNLGPRASAYLGFLFRTRILNLNEPAPTITDGEKPWLFFYGILSACYRLIISLVIAIYVAGRFFIAGILLAIWFLLYQVARPYALAVLKAIPLAQNQGKLPRLVAIFGVITMLVPALLWLVPVQQSTTTYGIIMPPESSFIRARSSGFITDFAAKNRSEVRAGEPVVNLRHEELKFQEQQQVARVAELEAEFRLGLVNKTGNLDRLKKDVLHAETLLTQTRKDISDLVITSPGDGRFLLISSEHIPGRWVERGTILGVVAGTDDWTAQVMFPQESINLLNNRPAEILAMKLGTPGIPLIATLDGQIPRATLELPRESLGSAKGGPIPVDVSDASGLKLLKPMFQVNVLLPEGNYHAGQTVLVWFLHEKAPVGARIWDWVATRLSMVLNQY